MEKRKAQNLPRYSYKSSGKLTLGKVGGTIISGVFFFLNIIFLSVIHSGLWLFVMLVI